MTTAKHIDSNTGKPKIILDLCGGTGAWSRPYKEAGYDVRLITLPEHDVTTYELPSNVYGILAAPPCTEFSVLNCVASPRERDEVTGIMTVFACLRIIALAAPSFWALENPRGFLQSWMSRPQFKFQPWEFGDAWTKATYIWGLFNTPDKKYSQWAEVPKLNLYTRPGRQKPSLAYLHKSAQRDMPQLQDHKVATDAEFRAITPPGFAHAFFRANP